jgi:transposase
LGNSCHGSIDEWRRTVEQRERALRHAVIWRKLSFGTRSAHSSRIVATILTVVETCRQQFRSMLEYLTTAMEAHFTHEPAHSLLPEA